MFNKIKGKVYLVQKSLNFLQVVIFSNEKLLYKKCKF